MFQNLTGTDSTSLFFIFICNLSCSVDEKTDFWINKKHKGLKKNTPGMDFESYLERLVTLHKYCFESKSKKIEQKRFQIISDLMQMKSVKRTQFSELNDRRFSFHDGIVSLPFGHFSRNKVRESKEKHRAGLHTKIGKEMYEF